MKICVVGAGYVGVVVGACLADLGHRVRCVDRLPERLAALRRGEVPFFEPGLHDIVGRGLSAGRLTFEADLVGAASDAELVFIAVGTPATASGAPDTKALFAAVDGLGPHLRDETLLIVKSTVPVGTADAIRQRLARPRVHVVSNPEFLAEGRAVADFTSPDRIVVGTDSDAAIERMARLYAPLLRTGKPLLRMDNRSAELAKYAANAMLATRLSLMNELASLSETVDADIESIRRAVGADDRIGSRYLFPGCGFGGSCFPKDLLALEATALAHGTEVPLVRTVREVNERQKLRVRDRLHDIFGTDLRGRRIAIWGLSFKPRTDDVREGPALALVEHLLADGAELVVYDPKAMDTFRARVGDVVRYAPSAMEAVDGADALLLVTEWAEFRSPDLTDLARHMRTRVVIDGRNVFEPEDLRTAGFIYASIGRMTVRPTAQALPDAG
jgi:UDPglucose 6-dehydrogenase